MIHRHSDFNESTPLESRNGRWLALYFAACLIAIAWAGIYFIA